MRDPRCTLLLRVCGPSMQEAGIHDGDWLLVDCGLEPWPGDVVLARLEDGFTVKRLVRAGDGLALAAAHPAYPFLYETREITGESSRHAVRLTGAAAPKAGSEVVASERAQTLVAYLLNVNSGFEYPEARPLPAKSAASPEAKK